MDLKEIIAVNIIRYRKMNNLTQLEVAEKLNYTDKAVSKWERAESAPDIYTLKSLALLFGVTIDDLCSEKEIKPKNNNNIQIINRILITALSAGIVWLVATSFFVIATLIPSFNIANLWMVFIYAIPISFIVFTVFAELWFDIITKALAITGIVFGVALAIHFTLGLFITRAWLIYIIAGVLEILVILAHLMSKFKRTH